MYQLGGKKGYLEKDYEYLLYFYTNEDILEEKDFDEWWEQFESLENVKGIGNQLRLFRDPDQRDGQFPTYKYLLIYGFKGDPTQMKKAIRKLSPREGNCVIFFKAIAPLYRKDNIPESDEEHIFMALTNAREGKDAEYNEWYNNHHIPDVVHIRCYHSGRRFKKMVSAGDDSKYDYLALYRFGGTPKQMRKILKDYAFSVGNLYMKKMYKPVDAAWVYSEITDTNTVFIEESLEEASKKAPMDFYEALKKRRSIYMTSGSIPITDEELVKIIKEVTNVSPSSFNSQSSKVMVLLGKEHEDFWNITLDTLRKVAPKDGFKATEDKIDMLACSHGTILYYEDMNVVKNLQKAFPIYKDNFPIWAEHSSAMLQLAIWTALTVEGIGATLQHYNPIIDKAVAKRFRVPSSWKLIAQMPFGGVGAKPDKAYHLPIDEKVLVLGND